jgi:uncharacterized damage-inducible protein DinB
MNETPTALSTIYDGWHTYQIKMVAALEPLSAEQLALRAAPALRSIGEMVTHMIGARARWLMIDEDTPGFAVFATWDRPGMPIRTTTELVNAMETTWQLMQREIAKWTPEDWQKTYPGEEPEEPALITRRWVIWHLIEHDLHHGGEVSLTLGMHGVPAPDL